MRTTQETISNYVWATLNKQSFNKEVIRVCTLAARSRQWDLTQGSRRPDVKLIYIR